MARALVALIATRRGTCTLTEVSRRYGRDVATLSIGVRKLEEKVAGKGKGADPRAGWCWSGSK
jgi:predicted transcriptional regulator